MFQCHCIFAFTVLSWSTLQNVGHILQFGTPEQDAFRRDFTINSLFYNINEGMVEDFTGKGIDDMRKGIIRTPLPAKETFLDGEYTCHDVRMGCFAK